MAKQDDISAMLEPLVTDLGYELVGIEYGPHPKNGMLRLYIDQPERGVNLDDCETVSREVSAMLDVEDPIRGHYTLEVSSPGLDRPLFKPEHFQRFLGEEAQVTVASPVDGRRKFKGPIQRVEGDCIVIDQDGQDVELEHANIVKARLVPQF